MSDITVRHTYKLKRGEESVLEERNPSLLRGEPIVAFDAEGTTKLKIGDGEHNYNDLPFIGGDKNINIATEITSESTDEEVASAKAVYNFGNKTVNFNIEELGDNILFSIGFMNTYVSLDLSIYNKNIWNFEINDPINTKMTSWIVEGEHSRTEITPAQMDEVMSQFEGYEGLYREGAGEIGDMAVISRMYNFNNAYNARDAKQGFDAMLEEQGLHFSDVKVFVSVIPEIDAQIIVNDEENIEE